MEATMARQRGRGVGERVREDEDELVRGDIFWLTVQAAADVRHICFTAMYV